MRTYGSKTVARCVDRVRNGATVLTVATDEGISEKTVRNWCKNANIRSPRAWWTEEEKYYAAKMWNEGSSCVQIGEAMGKSIGSIKAFLRNNRDIAPYRNKKNK